MNQTLNLHSYDKYIVSFSGGKDSTACFLYLLDNGIPLEKIELWHQDVDGRGDTFSIGKLLLTTAVALRLLLALKSTTNGKKAVSVGNSCVKTR